MLGSKVVSFHQVEQIPKENEIIVTEKGRYRVDHAPEYHLENVSDHIVLRVIKLVN